MFIVIHIYCSVRITLQSKRETLFACSILPIRQRRKEHDGIYVADERKTRAVMSIEKSKYSFMILLILRIMSDSLLLLNFCSLGGVMRTQRE